MAANRWLGGRSVAAGSVRGVIAMLGVPTVVIVGYYLLYVTAYFGSGLTGQARVAWSDGAYLPLDAAAVLLAGRAAADRLAGRRSQLAWAVITVALACQAWGDGAWFYLEGVRRVSPFPSIADVGYAGMYPLMFAGLLLLPMRRHSRARRAMLTLDAATVVGAGFMIIWSVSLGAAAHNGFSTVAAALNVVYPVGDLLLILGVVTVWLRGTGPALHRPMGLLLVGLSCWVVSDVAFAYLSEQGHGTGGRWVDLTWIAAQGCFAISADQHRLAVRRHAARPLPARPAAVAEAAPARLPYLTMLAANVVVAKAAVHLPLFPLGGLLLGDVAVVVAVVGRQLLAAAEYGRLAVRYQDAASTDELTGLLNRRHFFELAADRLAFDARAGQPTSAMLVDIDRFKDVNDSYGHLAGDAVLVEVAVRCQASLRGGDLLCRYGGDELLVLLPNTAAQAAGAVANRTVAAAAASPITAGPHAVRVSLSVGYATIAAGTELITLIGRADAALYTVKQHGRGRAAAFPTSPPEPPSTSIAADPPLAPRPRHGGRSNFQQDLPPRRPPSAG